MHRDRAPWLSLILPAIGCGLVACFLSCGLFEPRSPQDPTQSGQNPPPATIADEVVTNLQSAVIQGSVVNYMSCFADPAKTTRTFTFVPSAGYAAQLSNWSRTDEQTYFDNLVHRAPTNGFANLDYQNESWVRTSDSATFYCDYTFTFQHSVPNFPTTAQGSLQFSIAPGNDGTWMIYRWADFKTVTDTTWSLFKLKFSN